MNLPTPAEKQRMASTLREALKIVESLPVVRPCVRCDHHSNGYCEHWQSNPPEDWLLKGCDHWEEGIPF